MNTTPQTFLCLASYEKGYPFLRELKAQGCRVLLLTLPHLKEGQWPVEAIDEIYLLPDMYDLPAVLNAVSYLARSEQIDRIVALDDFDVETAAALREHLQIPGLGTSVARRFRDKLAMRTAAQQAGIPIPDFIGVLNYAAIGEWFNRVPGPWVLKPRSEAAATGIKIIHHPDEFWSRLEELGDRQSHHLLERYIPGAVHHVDSIIYRGQLQLAEAHQYGRPPLDIMQGGGIFITRHMRRGTPEEQTLLDLNARLITALGLTDGITHAEYIQSDADGQFYFLEIAARVGGANIDGMIEGETGLNPWREWARIEVLGERGDYHCPPARTDYAGIVTSLAHQEHPDTSSYTAPEIIRRLDLPYHIGFVVAAPDYDRVQTLLDDYAARIARENSASLPAPERLRIAPQGQ